MARQKNDTTQAETAETNDAPASDTAAVTEDAGATAGAAIAAPAPVGLFAEVQAAVNAAVQAGNYAAHGALSAIETCMVDLRMRLTTLEQDAIDDVKAMIEKIKAVL